MDHLENISDAYDAKAILELRNIAVLETVGLEVDQPYTLDKYVPHLHFMSSRLEEVAYYTPAMKTLVIFDEPRIWSEKCREAHAVQRVR